LLQECRGYKVKATGWTVGIQISSGARDFFTRLNRLWVAPSLLFNCYLGSFPEVKRKGEVVTFTVQFRPSPRLRMTGALPLSLYAPSWREWGQLYLFMCEMFRLCVCGLFNDAVSNTGCIAPSRITIRDNLSFSDWVACLRTVF
jgi:hypothetical protein